MTDETKRTVKESLTVDEAAAVGLSAVDSVVIKPIGWKQASELFNQFAGTYHFTGGTHERIQSVTGVKMMDKQSFFTALIVAGLMELNPDQA